MNDGRVVIEVSSVAELNEAVGRLPANGGEIQLRAGFYDLVEDLVIVQPNVTLRGLTNGVAGVVLRNGRRTGRPPIFSANRSGLCVEDIEFMELRIAV